MLDQSWWVRNVGIRLLADMISTVGQRVDVEYVPRG